MNLPPIGAMLEGFFAWTWKTSLQASVLIALVWIIQLVLGKWLSPRWRYALGLLVLLRLVLPVVPASNFSIFNLGRRLPTPSKIIVVPDSPPKPDAARPVSFPTGPTVFVGGTNGSTVMPGLRGALKGVWLLGFAGLLAVSMRQHRKLSRWAEAQAPLADGRVMGLLQTCKAKLNMTCEIKVVITTLLTTPAVFRFRKPHLLVPAGMMERLDDRELRMIFLHELVHIRHGDILLNWAAIIVRSLHWFNPLVWVAVRRLRADQELVCDARVVGVLAADERRLYGNTLIKLLDDFSEAGLCPSLVPVINSKQEIKRRITMIAKFRPTTRAALMFFMAIIVALCCFTFTRAADKERPQERPERAKARPDSIKEEAFQGLRQLGRELARLDNEIKGTEAKLDSLREELAIPNDFAVNEPAPPIEPETLRRLESVRIDARSIYSRWSTLYHELTNLSKDDLSKVIPTASPDPVMNELLTRKADAEQKLAVALKDLSPENIEVKRQSALLKTIENQIRERGDGIMEGIRIQAAAAEAQYKNVDEQIQALKITKIREAEKEQKKYDPYVATKRDLEIQKQRRQVLMMKITAEAIDALKDEFSENELKEKLEKEHLAKRKVNVTGQVFKQGPVEIPDDKPELTILDAIGMAGGTTRLAKESSVQVTRSGQKPLKFDLQQLRKETDPTKVFILQAGDIIFVPQSSSE